MMKRPYPELSRNGRARRASHSRARKRISSPRSTPACNASIGCSTTMQASRPRNGRRPRRRRYVHDARLPARAVRNAGRRTQSHVRLDRLSSRRWRSTAIFSRRRQEGAVQDRPARSAEESQCRHASSSATKRPRPTAKIVGILAQDQSGRDDRRNRPRASRSQSCSIARRSTAKAAARSATRASCSAQGFRFEVIDTQKEDGFMLHVGHLRSGRLELGDKVTARVDTTRRAGIRRAHSATHLLHYALQKHLGTHAQQQGSKVDDDWLRFDFANPSSRRPGADRARSRAEVNDKVAVGRAGRLEDAADRRGPQGRGDDAVRRKISRRRAHGFDGRVQQGALRRHARRQHGPGRPVPHRRRGKRVGRHAAHHRRHRPRGPRSAAQSRTRAGRNGRGAARASRPKCRPARRRW